eukprot:6181388-Pleurochrysis_carterae.AAC.3
MMKLGSAAFVLMDAFAVRKTLKPESKSEPDGVCCAANALRCSQFFVFAGHVCKGYSEAPQR